MPSAPSIAEAPPKKRLALFLDGTWNTVGDNTNVWRLRSLCAARSADGLAQLVYYDAGLGTKFGEKVRGGMFGYGISKNVSDAYEWLIENYNEGDDIFIFGFSRGAYTARSLAGFIALCGLLQPGAPLGVKQLYGRYRRGDEDRSIWKLRQIVSSKPAEQLSLEEQWMLRYSMAVNIKLVGVWDTVGSLGVPVLSIPGIGRSTFKFLHTGLRKPIQHGFHAIAIDEHRKAFSPTLWTIRTLPNQAVLPTTAHRPIKSVEQRWFAGAHANVGGGCQSDLLAQIPLRWLMSKASLHGLAFRNEVVLDGDVLTSPISDSYKEFMRGGYQLVSQRHYRPIGEAPKKGVDGTHSNVNETIDASVFDRWRGVEYYRPRNLAEWAERYAVDPGKLQTSVMAVNPATAAPD